MVLAMDGGDRLHAAGCRKRPATAARTLQAKTVCCQATSVVLLKLQLLTWFFTGVM